MMLKWSITIMYVQQNRSEFSKGMHWLNDGLAEPTFNGKHMWSEFYAIIGNLGWVADTQSIYRYKFPNLFTRHSWASCYEYLAITMLIQLYFSSTRSMQSLLNYLGSVAGMFFLCVIHIRWNLHLDVIHLLVSISQLSLAHATLAVMSCHIQHLLVIILLESR